MRCMDILVSTANGHTHALGLDEIRKTVTVPAGQEAEFTLTCAGDAKGIVAGYDMDEGLVNMGNDPRPIIRVFKFYNPTDGPLSVDLYLLCLKNRTRGGIDGGGHIVNTATVTTTTPESTTGDNSDSVAFNIDTSPPVVPALVLGRGGEGQHRVEVRQGRRRLQGPGRPGRRVHPEDRRDDCSRRAPCSPRPGTRSSPARRPRST